MGKRASRVTYAVSFWAPAFSLSTILLNFTKRGTEGVQLKETPQAVIASSVRHFADLCELLVGSLGTGLMTVKRNTTE